MGPGTGGFNLKGVMMLTVSKDHRAVVEIDGHRVQLRVQKFSQAEHVDFSTQSDFVRREEEALAYEIEAFTERWRAEQAAARGIAPEAVALPSDAALRALYEATLAPEAVTARRAREVASTQQSLAFMSDAIARYVAVEPGQMYDETAGREILTGADLAAHYATRADVLQTLLTEIIVAQSLTPDQKKAWWSRLDSPRISAASPKADGPRPDGTAGVAGDSGTATTAAAPARRGRRPSGATTPSRPSFAPSAASRPTSSGGSGGSPRRTGSPGRTASPATSPSGFRPPAASETRTRS